MKRNTIFMWAYITFIMLSIVFRLFTNYTLWQPTVIAVSISCVFFAVEDLLISVYKLYCADSSIEDKFVQQAEALNKQDIALLSEAESQEKATTNEQHPDVSIVEQYAKTKALVAEMTTLIDTVKKNVEKKRLIASHLKKWADIIAYIGFLCLFCLLVLSSYISFPELLQDVITIIPFLLVLIIRQLDSIFSERTKKELIASRDAIKYAVEASKSLKEYKEKYDYLIDLIRETSETAATTNAD